MALGGIKAFTEGEERDTADDPTDKEVETEHLMSDQLREKMKTGT